MSEELRAALDNLLRVAFDDEGRFLTQNNVPMEATPRVRRAVARARAALAQRAPERSELAAALDVERVRDIRLLMIDGIGADLSAAFAQGDPFEPFDRLYVLKRITATLDAARERARLAAADAAEQGEQG